MKKVILFSALALSVAVLTGCSDEKSTSTGGTTSKSSSEYSGVIVENPPEISGYSEAVQVTDDWKFVYDKKLGGIKILDCLCVQKNGGDRVYNSVEDIVVPRTFEGFEGLEVLEIGETALGYITECNSITLPDSIKYIDEGIFSGSTVKQPIIIPESVEDISEKAFAFTTCEIRLPSNLKKIPKWLFWGARITHFTIPSSVEVIEDNAFYQCQYLTDIDFGDGLKRIGESAFENCWGLETVTFNDGLEEIGEEAFKNCNKLRSVTFGNGLKKIGEAAFSNCSAMINETIYLPDTLTELGMAFPASLASLKLPRVLMYKGNLYSNDELSALLKANAAE